MIQPLKLEDLIREKVPGGVTDSRGFYSMKCQCCNDYKVRAGFKFDGLQTGFNCWNCGTTGRYEEFSGKMSKKMRGILNDFGIDDTEIASVVNSAFFIEKKDEDKITLANLTKVNTSTPPVKLPENSKRLGISEEDIDYQIPLVKYLDDRKVDLDKYHFYYSLEERFIDRVIIPFYRNGKLIYWQARTIHDHVKKRYDNAPVSRDAVIFNFDKLNTYSSEPLFVTEGVFDAMMFDSIAICGSKLTPAKTELLHKSNRKLIFVIDKDANGKHLADSVMKEGWQIVFVPDGASDLNNSVIRFGRTWTAYNLIKNISTDADSMQLNININCI